MGGWFSSNEKPKETPTRLRESPSYQYSAQRHQYETRPSQVRSGQVIRVSGRPSPWEYQLTRDINSLSIGGVRHKKELSRRNPCIFPDTVLSRPIVTYTYLTQFDPEYMTVINKITNKKNFRVDTIEKIDNQHLRKAYELKKIQKLHQNPHTEEKLLFHGTKRVNVDTICTNNFDWRLCEAHEYGRGVSFSYNSTYASNYSDKGMTNKIMLVVKVLVGETCVGNKFMELPNDGCDTSVKGDGIVTVKYEDNEFLPVYKITYHVVDENFGKGNRGRKGGLTQRNVFSDIYFS